jgi:hypothetical protein
MPILAPLAIGAYLFGRPRHGTCRDHDDGFARNRALRSAAWVANRPPTLAASRLAKRAARCSLAA